MSRSSPSNCSGACPHCAAKIPGWWVRDYCANCGEEIPQTAQQAEIARLRKAIEDIDDITGFNWPTMPELIKENIHKQLREIVLTALARPNVQNQPTESKMSTSNTAAQSGSSPSPLFGCFDLSKAVMTKEQEQHIQTTGCCPRPECQPREGRATPMRWLGSVGRAHSLHCKRCDSVWMVPPPIDEPNATAD